MGRQYTDEELLSQIRELAEGNSPPTSTEFRTASETVATTTIENRFGSWNNAVRAAGFEPHRERHTDEELLSQIQELAEGNSPPVQAEFETASETVSATTIENRFGSWNDAVRAAGLEPHHERHTDEELLSQIRELADGTSPPKSTKFHTTSETAAATTIQNRFGSWNDGIRAAGFEPKYRRKAVPLTPSELTQFINQIPQIEPIEQAVAVIALLTGCHPAEHGVAAEDGVVETETDPLIIFPSTSKRGTRSVSVGPLHSQLVREFDSITPERLAQSTNFSSYPRSEEAARNIIRRISRPIEFDVHRTIKSYYGSAAGPNVLHRDLRCTHYLFEYTRGASQAWLKRRFALTGIEINHYHHFLDNPAAPEEDGWSVDNDWTTDA
jgi:hypothetical protein